MKFEYLEVRPCIDIGGNVVSYVDEEEFQNKVAELSAAKLRRPLRFKTFWTLYGRHSVGGNIFAATAIGDFTTKQKAHDVMNAILAPMAAARNTLDAGRVSIAHEENLRARISTASDLLDDFINQCSNHERI